MPGAPGGSGQDPADQLSHQMSNDLHLNQPDQSGEPDEDELLEMMAMQDECRMEMMKFYIQSQNPELFSDIYHEVSYPDEPLKSEGQPASTTTGGDGAAASTSPTNAAAGTSAETTSSPDAQSSSTATTSTSATSSDDQEQQQQKQEPQQQS